MMQIFVQGKQDAIPDHSWMFCALLHWLLGNLDV